MSRVLKFRGKVDGAWWQTTPESANWFVFWQNVDRETVGQFFGLLDKHGVEVYEGDIYRNLDNGLIGTFYYQNNVGGDTLYCREQNADGSPHNLLPFMQLDTTNFEIIGNVFEHPHLLTAQQ